MSRLRTNLRVVEAVAAATIVAGVGVRTNAEVEAANKRPERICYSRLKKDKGECTHTGCRFLHTCGSCGADHVAVNCPRWDETKAAGVLAKQLAK